MKAFIKTVALLGIALLLPAPAAFAQERPEYAPEPPRQAQDRPAFSQQELDQMLAPIALYPDSLLSHILMAATYPLEVVQAARWSRANPGIKGADAVKAVEGMNWDPSVKSLVAFPDVLAMMDERLDWTEQLGEAFLAQQPQMMDSVQGLRRRAEEAGNLESDERMAVTRRDEHIMIEPADPQVVYVPYYNPRVVYGPWWWADYPPVYWGPPLGYYYGGPGGWGPGFLWGSPIAVVPGFFFGAFAWPHRRVTVVYSNFHRAYYARRGIVWTRRGPVVWRHDAFHRRSVPYRQAALRRQFAPSRAQRIESRRDAARPAAAPTTQRAPVERSRTSPSPDRRLERSRDPAGRSFNQSAPTAAPSASTDRRPAARAPQRDTEAGRAERPRSTNRREATGSGEDARRVQPRAAPRPDSDRQQFRSQRSGSGNATARTERSQRVQRAQRAERSQRVGRTERVQRGSSRAASPASDRGQRRRATATADRS